MMHDPRGWHSGHQQQVIATRIVVDFRRVPESRNHQKCLTYLGVVLGPTRRDKQHVSMSGMARAALSSPNKVTQSPMGSARLGLCVAVVTSLSLIGLSKEPCVEPYSYTVDCFHLHHLTHLPHLDCISTQHARVLFRRIKYPSTRPHTRHWPICIPTRPSPASGEVGIDIDSKRFPAIS